MADTPRLKQRYNDEIVAALTEQFGYANIWQVPRLVKISVNMGVGGAVTQPDTLDRAAAELSKIVGQRPAITRARKSIASFHLRQGMPIGCRATLRGDRMWEFMDKLVSLALPRIRDFRGLPADSFDGRGNYSLGVTDHLIFPELNFDEAEKVRGMDITIVTTAKTDEEADAFIRALGMPLKPKA